MASRPAYTAGKFAMQLEGADVGFLTSVEGGEAFGEVIDEAPVGARVPKHLGGVGYEPIVVELGPSMAGPLHDWVAATLDGTQTAKGGAIVMLDYAMKEQSRLEWKAALITEVGFPAADASSKEAARLRLTIQPESTQLVAGSGAPFSASLGAKAQKTLLSANFRFTVSGLEAAGAKVSKVALPLVRRVADDSTGSVRLPVLAGVLDVGDVAFWVAESELALFAAWFDDFVIKGNNGSTAERTGVLTFLESNLQSDVMRIELEGLGICRISHERQEAGSSAIALVKIVMYCEAVRLAKQPAAPPPAPAPAPSAPAEAAAESLVTTLVAALRAESASGVPTTDAIAERLLASVETEPTADERGHGRATGRKWASGQARLDELEQIATLAESNDWNALALGEGHSLVIFLAAAGVLPAGEDGPIDLKRDDFSSGLVDGAAAVYREVAPRLDERRQPRG